MSYQQSSKTRSKSARSSQQSLTRMQRAGVMVFFIMCGFPAMSMTGFWFPIPFTPVTASACVMLGSAIAGVLYCPRPWPAGLIGGWIAGMLGFTAIYAYAQHRTSLWNYEVVLVQCAGSLPGVGVGYLLKRLLSPGQAPVAQAERTRV